VHGDWGQLCLGLLYILQLDLDRFIVVRHLVALPLAGRLDSLLIVLPSPAIDNATCTLLLLFV
jgi:hypothetical protein